LLHSKTDALNYIAKILLNSLSGRFGMNDNFDNINVIHTDFVADFENKYLDHLKEKIDLGEYVLLSLNKIDDINEDKSTHNVSIGIAAAITAYSRIHMSKFKNNPLINLYYTDTDSLYTDSEIDPQMIDSKELGKLKLEHSCKKAIFLSPKVYCLETEDNNFIYKVKGLSHDVELNIEDFSKLLYKDAFLTKHQSK
jgi:hypothetical protein